MRKLPGTPQPRQGEFRIVEKKEEKSEGSFTKWFQVTINYRKPSEACGRTNYVVASIFLMKYM